MTDRFITVSDSLELPAAVKVPPARLFDLIAAGRALLDAADAAVVIASVSVAAGIVTRIMAIPQISDLLTRANIGPTPSKETP